MKHPFRSALILSLPLILAACNVPIDQGSKNNGGGTGNNNIAPTVAITNTNGVKVASAVTVAPNAQFKLQVADADGTVSGVSWALTRNGTTVGSGKYAASDIKANMDLALPTLSAGTYILTVTVTDNLGASSSASATLVVDATAPTFNSVSVDGAAVANGSSLNRPVGQTTTLNVTASDAGSATTINVYQGSTLIGQGVNSATVDITGSAATTSTYTIVAVDSVGNSTTQTFSVTYTSATGNTIAPQPVVLVNNTGTQPYSNILSVTVSAGVAAGVGIKQVILEVTDSKGIVDTTTYTATAENATFNIDTTKYPDGNLKLRAIAVDANGLRGSSDAQTVQIANSVAPTISIVTPATGSQVSGPTDVTVQVRQNNTDFAFNNTTNQATVEVIDGRGQLVNTQTVPLTKVNSGLWQGTVTVDFNATQYLNATYTIKASSGVTLVNQSSGQTITAISQVKNLSSTVEPPALNILLPVYYDPANPDNPTNLPRPILTRKSAVAIQVSDSDPIQQVQIQFTCDAANPIPGQTCNTVAYNYNIPIGAQGMYTEIFNTGVLMDGQPFVPNGNYIMRATAVDAAGNSNIKEMPITVDRAQSTSAKAGIADLGSLMTTVFDDGKSKLTPTSATWAIMGFNNLAQYGVSKNLVRDLQIVTIDGAMGVGINPQVVPNSSFIHTMVFTKAGSYSVDHLMQDMVTGVVEYYPGGLVTASTR